MNQVLRKAPHRLHVGTKRYQPLLALIMLFIRFKVNKVRDTFIVERLTSVRPAAAGLFKRKVFHRYYIFPS